MMIFPRWRPSAILDLLCEWLDHPRRSFGGLYHCAKFGWNWSSSFDNTQLVVFYDFGLKTPIHAPFLGEGGLGALFPQKMSLIVLIPKRTVLGRNHVIWAIKHEYRPHGPSWACEEEKRTVQDRTGKVKNGYISPIWGEAPTEAICIKNCLIGDPVDVITCAKFQNEIFRGYHFTGVEFSIFLLIFEWALQQCSATALPVMLGLLLSLSFVLCHIPNLYELACLNYHVEKVVSGLCATVCKTVGCKNGSPYAIEPLSQPVCPVCNDGVLWPNGWMDQGATWHGDRPGRRPQCVRWRPSSPKGAQPPIFGPCLLWLDESRRHLAGR